MIDYNKPILIFQTDFTYLEGAVASMYGVVKSVDRTLEIFDATHLIPQYDIYSASYRLTQYMRFWPKGSIFVSVVDPGVGTKRKACVAKTSDGYYVVTPDNGSLSHLLKQGLISQVRQIDESVNRLKGKDNEDVTIFAGRDLFAYTAARLASGIIDYSGVGPLYDIKDIVSFNLTDAYIDNNKVLGYIEIDDPNFGNLWTNINMKLFKQLNININDYVSVTIKKDEQTLFNKELIYVSSFGDTNKNDCLIYHNEVNNIALAMNQNSFKKTFNINSGLDYKIEFSKVNK